MLQGQILMLIGKAASREKLSRLAFTRDSCASSH